MLPRLSCRFQSALFDIVKNNLPATKTRVISDKPIDTTNKIGRFVYRFDCCRAQSAVQGFVK